MLYSKQHESKSWQLGTGRYRWMALEDLRDAVIWEIFMTKKDWYEAGDQIRNLVQDAIDKEDFSQLSSTISNVVNDTIERAGEGAEGFAWKRNSAAGRCGRSRKRQFRGTA